MILARSSNSGIKLPSYIANQSVPPSLSPFFFSWPAVLLNPPMCSAPRMASVLPANNPAPTHPRHSAPLPPSQAEGRVIQNAPFPLFHFFPVAWEITSSKIPCTKRCGKSCSGTCRSTRSFWQRQSCRSTRRTVTLRRTNASGAPSGLNPVPAPSSPYLFWGTSSTAMSSRPWTSPTWISRCQRNSAKLRKTGHDAGQDV